MNFLLFFKNILFALLLSSFALFLMAVIELRLVRNVDEQFVNTHSQFVNAVMEREVKRLKDMVYDYTFWDKAVEEFSKNKDNFDEKWLRQNVDEAIIDTFGMTEVIVLNERNEKTYTYSTEHLYQVIDKQKLLNDYPSLNTIINKTRASKTNSPEVFFTIVRIDNKTYMAFASALTYQDQENIERDIKQQHVLLFFRLINKDFLEELRHLYGFEILTISDYPSSNKKEASVELKDIDNNIIAYINFIPPQPGLSLFKSMGFIVALFIFAFACISVLSFYNAWKYKILQKQLKEINHQLEDSNNVLEKKVEKRTRELKKAKEIAEESNKAKSMFLSTMSHEFMTPLNCILGFCQMLGGNHGDNLTYKQKQWIIKMTEASKHLHSLIKDVLDLSQIESNHFVLDFEDVNLSDIFDKCHNNIKEMAYKKYIELERKEVFSQKVHTDKKRIEQILDNLLSNAVKYNKDNGQVCFGAEDLKNGYVRLFVSDTGIGIPDDEIKNIFKSFHKIIRKDVEVVTGTGVGLFLVAKIVEVLGGKISVESKLGEGSTFYVDIPTAPQNKT